MGERCLDDGGVAWKGKGFLRRNRRRDSPFSLCSPEQKGIERWRCVEVHQSRTQKEIRSVHKRTSHSSVHETESVWKRREMKVQGTQVREDTRPYLRRSMGRILYGQCTWIWPMALHLKQRLREDMGCRLLSDGRRGWMWHSLRLLSFA